MKTKGKAWKLKNKGFTLIEMIVTVAIIAIFSGVVVTFIGTGSGVYRNTSSNSKVQMETQETFDKIEDLIIDANRSLYYANGSGSNIGTEIKNDIKEKGGTNSTGNKTFISCNEYENSDGTSQYIYDVLDWQSSDGKIYYSRREYTAQSSNDDSENENQDDNDVQSFSDESGENAVSDGSDAPVKVKNAKTLVERSVLASGILDFRADVSKVESDKIVRFQLTTENGNKQIQTLHSVSLRNNVDLKKPADAFNNAEATDVGIKIINAPESMDPGESMMLAYGLTGNGSIDPTTVTWTVVDNADNGSFPTQDHTNGRLTISDSASGYITVQVSAVSTTGQLVVSQIVTIKINGTSPSGTPTPSPTPMPSGLLIGTKSILVAAGYSNLDLGQEIICTVSYDNGETKKLTAEEVKWSLDCNYVSIDKNGILSVDSSAGTAESGWFEVTVTAPDYENVSAKLYVAIARVTLEIPAKNGTYSVGDQKELQYKYMENGKEEDNEVIITTDSKPENAKQDYAKDGYFEESDIGWWKVSANANLKNGNKYEKTYGTVSDFSKFTVRDGSAGDIIVNKNYGYDTVIAGRSYNCAPTVNWGFNFFPNVDQFWENSEIIWTLRDAPAGVSIKNGSLNYVNGSDEEKSRTAVITVDKNVEKGFIVCAEYRRYADKTKTKLVVRKYAERAIKVANGIVLSSLSGDSTYAYNYGDALYSEGLEMNVLLNIYDVDGEYLPLCVSNENGTAVDWTGLGSGTVETSDDQKNWKYISSVHNIDQTLQITASIQRVAEKYGIFDCNNNYYGKNENDKANEKINENFKKSISVKILEPELTARIVPEGDETIEPGTTKELYFELLDKNGNLLKRDVGWSVVDNTTGSLSNYSTSTGANQTTVFSASKPGTYTVTANYAAVENRKYNITKTITVRKPEVNLTLHGPENGYNNDTANYWLEATVDGKNMTDMQVTWTTNWAGKLNKKESTVGENNAVQVTFHSDATACEITASVNVAGETIEVSKTVSLRKHEYTMIVTVVDPNTNTTVNSCVPGMTVKFVAIAYLDGNEINDCQFTWNNWGGEFNISGNTAMCRVKDGEKSIEFQVHATGGGKTQHMQMKFDTDGLTEIKRW